MTVHSEAFPQLPEKPKKEPASGTLPWLVTLLVGLTASALGLAAYALVRSRQNAAPVPGDPPGYPPDDPANGDDSAAEDRRSANTEHVDTESSAPLT